MKQALSVDEKLLKSVSRSFYTSLSVLPSTVRPTLSLAYLLCRTADTITDTEVIPPLQRAQVLAQYRALFDPFPISLTPAERLQTQLSSSFALPATPEGRLLSELSNAFAVFNSFSATHQAIIKDVVRGVIDGMMFDLQTFGLTTTEVKALETESALERYIHWIGGEPGRFWIRVCLERFPSLQIANRAEWIHQGIQYGMGLQMINILRDLPQDLKKGRCYIPNDLLQSANLTPASLLDTNNTSRFLPLYHALIDQTLIYLEKGVNTLQQIPNWWFRLRAAMWWPLILGLRTLAQLRVNPTPLDPTKIIKITRKDVYNEMIMSAIKLPSNKLLRIDFDYWQERCSSKI